VRTAPREPVSFLSRLRRWWASKEMGQARFRIGDRVRITHADPRFVDRIGIEATVVSEPEEAANGRMYYRLDNGMSAQPECLTLLEPVAEAGDSID